MLVLLSLAVLLAAAFCVLAEAVRNSRPGFEDATGFHEIETSMPSGLAMPVDLRNDPGLEAALRETRPALVDCARAASSRVPFPVRVD